MEQPKRRRIPKDVRTRVFNLCNGHCAYCGCAIDPRDMQVDHYLSFEFGYAIAQGKGDINSEGNYLPACRSCNYYKSGMHIEQFRRMVSKWHEILMRDSVTYRNAVRFRQVIPAQHVPVFYFEETGVHIPAMDWDKDFREKMHKEYFQRKGV